MFANLRAGTVPVALPALALAAGLALSAGAPLTPAANAAASRPAGLDPGYPVVEPNSTAGADVRAGRTPSAPVLLHLVDEATNAAQGYTGITHVNVTCWARGASVAVQKVLDGQHVRYRSGVWYRLLAEQDGQVAWVPAARTMFLGDLRPAACAPEQR
jgi:hypothetical protein